MSPMIAKTIPGKDGKVVKKKKFTPPIFRCSRTKALAFLKSQNCTSAWKGIAKDEISTEYNPIYTQDIVTRLARYGFMVCGCGQQVTRRNWKRYNNPEEKDYIAKIDAKQNAAKHYVILKHQFDSHPFKIMITNSHNGNMATKLYYGVISGDSDLQGVQCSMLLHFESFRHTKDNALRINSLIDSFVEQSMGPATEEFLKLELVTLSAESMEKYLGEITKIPKKTFITPQVIVDQFYATKQSVWPLSLWLLVSFGTDIMVNHFIRNRRSTSVAAIHRQSQLALSIHEYVAELLKELFGEKEQAILDAKKKEYDEKFG